MKTRKGESKLDVDVFRKLVGDYERNHSISPEIGESHTDLKREVLSLSGIERISVGSRTFNLSEASTEAIEGYYLSAYILVFGRSEEMAVRGYN